jgi:pimeloyl-ACP methyl ester carboxylesterase
MTDEHKHAGLKMHKKIKFDASRLAVATGGAGEPAVFVHGFGSNKFTWKHLCDGLTDVFTFYAIDLPGSGESPAPRDFHYTLEHFADVLTEFIIMKDLKKLTLVGTSFGAAVVLLALLGNRDELAPRVRSLCLIDAVAYPQDFPFFVEILRTPVLGPLAFYSPLFFVKILRTPVFGRPLTAISLPPQYARYYARKRVREALIKTARLINSEQLARYVRRLKTIHLPTLVIWGRRDRVVPLRLGKRLARDLPNSRLIVIDHCGHAPHQECPAKVIAALKEFAQTTGDDGGSASLQRGTEPGP